MKKLFTTFLTVTLLSVLSFGQNTEYKLSKRTYEQLQVLEDKIETANTMKAILAIGGFATVFNEDYNIVTIVNIGLTDWHLFSQAAKGLNTTAKTVLEKFCDTEAFLQRKSKDDFKFWQQMAKSFQ